MFTTLTQGYAVLAFLYAGIVVGILYDLLRIPRQKCGKHVPEIMLDAIFGVLSGLLCETVFLLVDGGALRFYGFLWIMGGYALQQWVIGKRICKMIVKCKRTRAHS